MSWQVDALALSDDLLLATDQDLWPGLDLCINVPLDSFWMKIVAAERLEGHSKHNWRVSVEGPRMDELREALTYHVARGHTSYPPDLLARRKSCLA